MSYIKLFAFACLLLPTSVVADVPEAVAPMGPPTDVHGQVVAQGFQLNWSAPAQGQPDGYIVHRYGVGSVASWTLGPVDGFLDVGTFNDTYMYIVQAIDERVPGLPTNPILTGQYPMCTWAGPLHDSNGNLRGVVVRPGCLLPYPGTTGVWFKIEQLLGQQIPLKDIEVSWALSEASEE